MNRLVTYAIVSAVLINSPHIAFSQTEKIFKTKYTAVHYEEDGQISDFIWRIGGNRFEFAEDAALASNRIDRIVEKVKTVLGMWTKTSTINIYLHTGEIEDDKFNTGEFDKNKTAYYEAKTGAIHISVENASDGVLAHEIAHAVINRYFVSPPPSKVQEILAQYVDKYLWSDY